MAITVLATLKKENLMPSQLNMVFFGDSIMAAEAKQIQKIREMNPASIPSPEEMRSRIERAKSETQRRFLDYYWPKISEVAEELAEKHIETSGISRGVAHGNLRAIAFALSVAGDSIASKQRNERVFTPLEGYSIFRGDYADASFEVGALSTDRDSLRIAERIHESLVRSKAKVSSKVYLLSDQNKNLQGIHLVLPSNDLQFNFGEMIRGFSATELQYSTDVRVVPQPPTIVKIEVWPQAHPNINTGPDLFNLHR